MGSAIDEKFVLSAYQRALLLHQGSLGLIPTELISQVSAMVDANQSQPTNTTADLSKKPEVSPVKTKGSPQEGLFKKSDAQIPSINTSSASIAKETNGKDSKRGMKNRDEPPELSHSKDEEGSVEQDEDEPPPNKKARKVQPKGSGEETLPESNGDKFLDNTETIVDDYPGKSLPDASQLPKLPGMDDRLSALCLSWYYAGYKAGYSS